MNIRISDNFGIIAICVKRATEHVQSFRRIRVQRNPIRK